MAYCRIVVPKNETDAEIRFLFTASGNPFDIVWEDMDIREHPVFLKVPDTPQKERIELLIKALEEEIARREEEARLLAEQNKAQWEEYDGNLNEKKKDSFTPDWEHLH